MKIINTFKLRTMKTINAFKLAVIKNYVNFSGRTNRSEYWYFFLANLIIGIITSFLDIILPDIYTIISLALVPPVIAIAVRRLHDINKSGWFLLLALIPIIGLYFIQMMIRPGDTGSNNYGEPSNNNLC